jgi:protein involved in polysaccharide export with SLBB domain
MKRPSTVRAVAVILLAVGLVRGQAPEPASEPLPDLSDRKIAVQDVLQIVIVGENLPTEYRVSASGTINFPFLEVVEVKGLTPREVDLKLEGLLSKDYFVKPEVLVDIKEYRQDFVRMIGQVNRPGPLTLKPEQQMDLLDALSFAGGTTRLAKGEVEFIRDGQRQVFSIEKLKRETDPAKKVWLRPGDIIEVKERIW